MVTRYYHRRFYAAVEPARRQHRQSEFVQTGSYQLPIKCLCMVITGRVATASGAGG